MDALWLVGAVALVLGGLAWMLRAETRRLRALAERAALLRGGSVEATPASPATALFPHEGYRAGLWFGQGAHGPHTGALVRLPEPPAQAGTLRVYRRGPRSLRDYADRAKAREVETGDAGFDGRFRLEASPEDRGLLLRLLDEPGRKVVDELSYAQGEHAEPVVELGPDGTLRTWAEGHVDASEDLEKLLELTARLARRISTPPPPPPEDEGAGPIEV